MERRHRSVTSVKKNRTESCTVRYVTLAERKHYEGKKFGILSEVKGFRSQNCMTVIVPQGDRPLIDVNASDSMTVGDYKEFQTIGIA